MRIIEKMKNIYGFFDKNHREIQEIVKKANIASFYCFTLYSTYQALSTSSHPKFPPFSKDEALLITGALALTGHYSMKLANKLEDYSSRQLINLSNLLLDKISDYLAPKINSFTL